MRSGVQLGSKTRGVVELPTAWFVGSLKISGCFV